MKMMPTRHLLYTIRSLPLAIYLPATLAENLAKLIYVIEIKYACNIAAICSRQIIKQSLQGYRCFLGVGLAVDRITASLNHRVTGIGCHVVPDLHAKRLAVPALVGTFGIQTLAATAMFGVSVVAPAAAPDIGVEATHVGTFTAIAYGSGLVAGLITGALADRYGAIRVSQLTMIFAFLACCFFAFGRDRF